MTITFGWWAVPLFFMIAAFGYAFWLAANITRGSSSWGDGIVYVYLSMVALIFSLVAWLIYFIIF